MRCMCQRKASQSILQAFKSCNYLKTPCTHTHRPMWTYIISMKDSSYVVIIFNDYSVVTQVFFERKKNEAFNRILKYVQETLVKLNQHIMSIQNLIRKSSLNSRTNKNLLTTFANQELLNKMELERENNRKLEEMARAMLI